MSRPGVIALLLAGAWSGAVRAQDAAAWRDSLTRLTSEVRALRDSLVSTDSTVVELERNNGVVLSATAHLRGPAIQAFRYFAEQRARWFGSALPSAGGFRLVVQTREGRNLFAQFGERESEGKLVLSGLPDTASLARMQRASSRAELGSQLVTGLAELMFPTLGAATSRWLTDPPPLHLSNRDRRVTAMYMIMTSTGKAGRGCVQAVSESCAFALGLRVAPTADLTDAYPRFVRSDLFLTALEIGGPDAWSRVMSARPARAEDALVAASGLPADSLIARWRSGLMALRPSTGPLHAGMALLLVGWAAALLFGTLGASRWR